MKDRSKAISCAGAKKRDDIVFAYESGTIRFEEMVYKLMLLGRLKHTWLTTEQWKRSKKTTQHIFTSPYKQAGTVNVPESTKRLESILRKAFGY